MSLWTYVSGIVEVHSPGRTQAESRYVLETVLNHLPVVTGSEGSMGVHIVQESNRQGFRGINEFYQPCPDWKGVQPRYVLVLDGRLRDREFEQTKHEFCRWICRLSKRISVEDVLVRVQGRDKSMVISDPEPFFDMFEDEEGEPRWTDYLFWDRAEESHLPLALARKYHIGEADCAEYDRQRKCFERV